ncbi:MAG: hypothetical protein ACP5D6_09980, partial [Kosmotogaceae bacterium]
MDNSLINRMIDLVENLYPDWKGFEDERFVKDEITYKKDTIKKAKELLSENEIRRLIEEKNFEELQDRILKIGRDNNLLFNSVPTEGDLKVLFTENLDQESFYKEFLNLIHGEGTGEERLKRYVEYANRNNLHCRWPFPTYFLFITDPENEIFVKPTVAKWLLKLFGEKYSSDVTAEKYKLFKEKMLEIKNALKKYNPKGMLEIQSFVWVAFREEEAKLMKPEKEEEFLSLFDEYVDDYAKAKSGKEHFDKYKSSREEAKKNFDEILNREERGEDITDLVLLKLLPYEDNEKSKEARAWTSTAACANTSLKAKYENAGWVKAEDWPRIASEILKFVKNCYYDPDNLEKYCKEFGSSEYSTGFQSAFLTPILNALNPEKFNIYNSKPLKVLNYFLDEKLDQKITDYPKANKLINNLLEEYKDYMASKELGEHVSYIYDSFCHWIVAVKKYNMDMNYWKIAPGENAYKWEECLDGGFIEIGWNKLGDISNMKKSEFNKKQDELYQDDPHYTKSGANQVWKFRNIKEGDIVVANRGTSEVLGIGMVTGSYYFDESEERHPHKLPVDWFDTRVRSVNKPGWRKTLIKLDRDEYEEIINSKPKEPDEEIVNEKDRSSEDYAETVLKNAYKNEEHRKAALKFLSDSIEYANNKNPNSWEITLFKNFVRLNVGRLYTIDLKINRVVFFAMPEFIPDVLKNKLSEYISIRKEFDSLGNEVARVRLPIDIFADYIDQLQNAHNKFLDEAIKTARSSPYYNAYSSGVVKYLNKFLAKELPHPEYHKEDEEENGEIEVNENAPFSKKAVELLEEINKNPTRKFYLDNKEDFVEHLEEPMKLLFAEISSHLPKEMLSVLETEKNIVSRFAKNDFGRGGAWDFIWGAFYPKGGKRIRDAQLYVWFNKDIFEYGFSIGAHKSVVAEKFKKNLFSNRSEIIALLKDDIPNSFESFGEKDTSINTGFTKSSAGTDSFEKWVNNIQEMPANICNRLRIEELLRTDKHTLVDKLTNAFISLMPFVYLTTEDEPMVSINEFISEPPESIVKEYPLDQISEETSMNVSELRNWLNAIKRKKQAIIYGPPGTGKTFVAEKLAKNLIGGSD